MRVRSGDQTAYETSPLSTRASSVGSVSLAPTSCQSPRVPAIVPDTSARPVTYTVTESPPAPSCVTLIVARPGPMPVTAPVASTEAISGADEVNRAPVAEP